MPFLGIFDQPEWTKEMFAAWPDLSAHLAKSNHKFNAYAKINDGFKIPDGVYNSKQLSRAAYQMEVSSAKVMLGINKPEISPSPYLAL